MTRPMLVFDMDGVLVDVTESYRETIARTVEHFTGRPVARRQIQEYKNQGGWNDDWKLSHHMIASAGVDVAFEEVKAHFQSIFVGERRPARPDPARTLDRPLRRPGKARARPFASPSSPAVRKTRPGSRSTASRRNWSSTRSSPWRTSRITSPRPKAFRKSCAANGGGKLFYIGDTVDDARCARAAGVPFVGVAAPSNPLYLDLVFLFQKEGAYAIVDDINYLEEVFAS